MATAVRDLLLDPATGDLAVVAGDFGKIADEAAVEQGIRVKTRFFRGESFLDESVGVPWREQILVKNPRPTTIRAALAAAMMRVHDVTQVVGADLQLDRRERTGSISYKVATRYGSQIAGNA